MCCPHLISHCSLYTFPTVSLFGLDPNALIFLYPNTASLILILSPAGPPSPFAATIDLNSGKLDSYPLPEASGPADFFIGGGWDPSNQQLIVYKFKSSRAFISRWNMREGSWRDIAFTNTSVLTSGHLLPEHSSNRLNLIQSHSAQTESTLSSQLNSTQVSSTQLNSNYLAADTAFISESTHLLDSGSIKAQWTSSYSATIQLNPPSGCSRNRTPPPTLLPPSSPSSTPTRLRCSPNLTRLATSLRLLIVESKSLGPN